MALRGCVFVFVVVAAYATPPLPKLTKDREYLPDLTNVYHLYTRLNPTVSQPMILGQTNQLLGSNFDRNRRTAILLHGWQGYVTSAVNTVLVPAFLNAADMNVIVVDWSVGASLIAGNSAPNNTVLSGYSVARFIDWLILTTGADINDFHVVGHSLGAHQAGVVGRNTRQRLPYITVVDPGANMEDSGHLFGPDAAIYTEAIHTNVDIMGHGPPVAHVDFYPNGGSIMPGCGVNFICNHYRSFYYFAESLNSGGFSGRSCSSYAHARLGMCYGLSTLPMGGLTPKTGISGLYHLTTNAAPLFSQG